MALKSLNAGIPEDAIILTRREAIKYQWEQIHNWKPQREVWPFSFGIAFLGGVAALSSLYINLRVRRAMKIRSFGLAASGISVTVCSGMLSTVSQMQMIAEQTFFPNCPLCIEMKSIGVQNVSAVVYPMILAPIVNLLIAKRAGTFRLPYYTNWKEILYFGVNLCKPIVPSLAFLSTMNAVAAIFILHKQYNCISYMHDILSIEKESDETF